MAENSSDAGASPLKAGHTPGPWQSQHDYDIDGICAIIGNIDGPDDGRMHFTHICEVMTDDADEARANARLIAAAPDLLEMLQEMIADSDDVDDGKLPRISAATLVRARQAIAKAKGSK